MYCFFGCFCLVLHFISQDFQSPLGGEHGADALSLMQHFNEQAASVYKEAEGILLSMEEGGYKAEEEIGGVVSSSHKTLGIGKENAAIHSADGPLCSPGSLLVLTCPLTSHTLMPFLFTHA